MLDSQVKVDIIHDNEYITVWYYPELKIMHHKMHKTFRGPEYRLAMLKGVKALERNGAHKWLSDLRFQFILPEEDQAWVSEVWFPVALKAGWRYCAVVKPGMAIVDLYVRRFIKKWAELGVTTNFFQTPEDGMRWLRAVAETSPDGG